MKTCCDGEGCVSGTWLLKFMHYLWLKAVPEGITSHMYLIKTLNYNCPDKSNELMVHRHLLYRQLT